LLGAWRNRLGAHERNLPRQRLQTRWISSRRYL